MKLLQKIAWFSNDRSKLHIAKNEMQAWDFLHENANFDHQETKQIILLEILWMTLDYLFIEFGMSCK